MTEGDFENKYKLYSLLVDQIQKYNTIFWQFPTVLSIANFALVGQLIDNSSLLLGLSLLNIPFIYAFYKMRERQKELIDRAKFSEEDLSKNYKKYSGYIPHFDKSCIRAPELVLWTFLIFDLALLFYSLLKVDILNFLILI